MSRLFKEFLDSEKAGGFILISVTIVSLILSNTSFQSHYIGLWQIEIVDHSLIHWINDGLMTVFFLLIGLELEREIYAGELSSIRKASLPFFAALGGMVFPAGIFLLFNYGTSFQGGAGIPTATDIAFAIGILSLAGKNVPVSIKIFLTALAVIDDLGAIIIISLFYSDSLVIINLLLSLGIFGVLILLNKSGINNLVPYIAGGLAMWFFMEKSGIHATISGVLLAFAIPFRNDGENSPSFRLQHWLHVPVAFIILPLFALANTAIPLTGTGGLFDQPATGIMAGLLIGKPAGILLFSMLAVYIGLSELYSGLKWKMILGAGFLGGIGFTMSIFITLLAFDSPEIINVSKLAVLIASTVAGLIGLIILKMMFTKNIAEPENGDT
ncbi:MAG TPA: Na+/H+ antiporter NhaA [Bacteroidales bacterium]|nr:Na+/H+ antiporter NhaA [Bacteroidales bacterium]